MDLTSAEGKSSLENFLSLNGPNFYGFEVSRQTFTLQKVPSHTKLLETPNGTVTPLPSGLNIELTWSILGAS